MTPSLIVPLAIAPGAAIVAPCTIVPNVDTPRAIVPLWRGRAGRTPI